MSNTYLVNLIPDPSCTAIANATAVNGSVLTEDSTWSADGKSGSYEVAGTAANHGISWTVALSQPGDTCTFALDLRAGAMALPSLTLQAVVAGETFTVATPAIAAWGDQRVALTFAVPTSAAQGVFEVLAPANVTFWTDDIVVAMTDADPGPMNGALPKQVMDDGSSYVYVWQGAANGSMTTRYLMQEVLPTPTPTSPVGPQPTQSPAALQDLWRVSFAVADSQNPNGSVLDGVTAAAITHDWFSSTKSGLTLTVLRHPNLAGYYADWPTASVLPSTVDANGKATQLGVFVVTGVQEAVDASGAYTLAVTCQDRTVLLSGNVWMDSNGNPATASFASGTNLLSIINQILACAGIAPIKNVDADVSSKTITNDFTYPVGTDLLTMANDLLQNTGYRALSVKGDGTFYIAPSTSLSLRTTSWTHSGSMSDGVGSKRSPAFGMTRNLFGIPNKVVCVSAQFGDASLGLDFTSTATDTDPSSPFSYLPNPDPNQPPIRGWRTKVYTDIAVDNQAALDTIAKQYLAQLQGQSRTATVQHLYMEGFDAGTSVLFSDTTSGQATQDSIETEDSFLTIVTSQSVDLINMGLTSSTLLEITSGVTDWNDGSTDTLGEDTTDQYIVD